MFILLIILSLLNFHREPYYCKLVDEIMTSYNKEVRSKYGLRVSGHGGAMMHDVKEIVIHYSLKDCLNIDQARALYLSVTEGLLECVNAHEKIRPFLHDYPFTLNNLEVMIGLENQDGEFCTDGYVTLIFVARDAQIFYEGYDPETDSLYTIKQESYEEAEKILESQLPNPIPQTPIATQTSFRVDRGHQIQL